MVLFPYLATAMFLLFLFMFRKQSSNGSLFKRFSKTGSDIFGKTILQSRQGESNGMETSGIVAVRSVLFILFIMIEKCTIIFTCGFSTKVTCACLLNETIKQPSELNTFTTKKQQYLLHY